MCHLKHLKYDTVFQLSIAANQSTSKLEVFNKFKDDLPLTNSVAWQSGYFCRQDQGALAEMLKSFVSKSWEVQNGLTPTSARGGST